MKNNVIKVVKNGVKKLVDNRWSLLCALSYGMLQVNDMVCYAEKKKTADTSATNNSVVSGLNTLKTLVVTVIGAIGVIYLAKSIMEFATAYQQSDSSGMNSALKGIAGGAMMAGISTVITILGFN